MKCANLLLSIASLCLLSLEFGIASADDNSPSVALTRRAMALGLAPSALGELWRTKQPLIISKTVDNQLYTTTYMLTPDNQDITFTTLQEAAPTARLETTPTPTPVQADQPTSPQTDWEYLPNAVSNRRTFTLNPQPFGGNWPNFGVPSSNWPSFDFPAGATPQTSTKTEVDSQGNTVTTTTKTYKGTLPHSFGGFNNNWPSFNIPAGATPQTSTKTELDDQGNRVTTTIKTYQSPTITNTWHTNTPTLPTWFNNPFDGQTTKVPVAQPMPTPLPYPLQPTRPTLLTGEAPIPTPASSDAGLFTTTQLPSLEDFLNQSGSTTPLTTVGNVQPMNTKVTRYSGTFSGSTPASTAELGTPVQEMLSRAGITDEDLRRAQATGGVITRERVMPDGRIVKTTVRLNSQPGHPEVMPMPAEGTKTYGPGGETPAMFNPVFSRPLTPTPANGGRLWPGDKPTDNQTPENVGAPAQGNDNIIDNFLSKVNLSPADILAQKGEVVKTIVDGEGRVLSARFVLSTIKGDEEKQPEPTK
ncbi:mucin-6-like [Drosophila busckii]|uniref:mucin-6-like n=1 Tax=Drosophila busckii TaxID=30019 RepID=UPI00083ECCA1|nr:mucin-6-like [Drosophila busckii]